MEKIEQGEEHEQALEMWLESMGGFESKQLFEMARIKAMAGTLYRIKPNFIQILHEELFGDFGFKTINFDEQNSDAVGHNNP